MLSHGSTYLVTNDGKEFSVLEIGLVGHLDSCMATWLRQYPPLYSLRRWLMFGVGPAVMVAAQAKAGRRWEVSSAPVAGPAACCPSACT